jgi:hypothetical protein
METDIFGVEDIMLIQWEKCKEDRRIYTKSITGGFGICSNVVERVYSPV